MSVHVFGIRHHGPGSARSLVQALTALQPDVVLIEGPPEADAIIPLVAHAQMQAPVAALIYSDDESKHAVYYPFAVFSPEWQALNYALTQQIPVQFMDLPMSIQFALAATDEEEREGNTDLRHDPLRLLAQAAGFEDSERWWSSWVEERKDSSDIFAAIAEAMTALRQTIDDESPPCPRELLREAHMRKTIRAAQKQGFERIAVVCGAWHVPALQHAIPAKNDNDLLKNLAKTKTVATWIPWTYSRLSLASGYGAGITSPNWYHYLWQQPDRVIVHWLTQVAHLLRSNGIDISAAHVIESVRLAETLAALRDRPVPGLDELNEAVQSVMLFGDPAPMRLVEQQLVIGECLGQVPDTTPMTPLQKDLAAQQKRLRLVPSATQSKQTLDLRNDVDLQRSYLLRRLRLLGIDWGTSSYARGKGTFKEAWDLHWSPEFVIRLIEAGHWGNTVAAAAGAYTIHQAKNSTHIVTLTTLAQDALFANLETALEILMDCLQTQAALATDVVHLMQALPSLAQLMRYGDVRKTSLVQVSIVVSGLITRICIGLPPACHSLNEEAAEQMFKYIQSVQDAVGLLADDDFNQAWYDTLSLLIDQSGIQGLLAGRCCRLLLQAGILDTDAVAQRLSLALSTANDPAQSAAWADGFLRDGGQLLIYDETLWQIIDGWVSQLPATAFQTILPILRRTFSTFDAPIRRQIGERVQHKPVMVSAASTTNKHNAEQAAAVLPLLAQLLSLEVH